MINKRLIKSVPDATEHIVKNVLCQIVSLVANVTMMVCISLQLADLIGNLASTQKTVGYMVIIMVCIAIRIAAAYEANRQSYLSSKLVKSLLRSKIYEKLIRLGARYNKQLSTAELLQVSIEGVEQLETYFGSYLPQFFYSMIAPIILFFTVSFINIKVAVILFICVPLIPISIIAIQKIAKKLLFKYWGEYTGLADNFLENLQGLNTLKIYSSDEFKHRQMNKQAERFRVITMKVLSMQLNSIIVMDIVAYGGAALGIVVALVEYSNANISLFGMFAVIMLSASFFLPLRMLGSFFHIAMNGIAASKKIFNLLDIEPGQEKTKTVTAVDINIRDLSFAYDTERVLHHVDIDIPRNSFVSIVGESGCGKSTIAGILSGLNESYEGNVTIGGIELDEIDTKSLRQNITLVGANAYIFKGTVRENLLMADGAAEDQKMWDVLCKVNLADFLRSGQGLETKISEKGSNLSGGQCQRLALARALLHDTEIYIFDEATSNIDAQSEDEIMQVIKNLASSKTVVLISHRLNNVVDSDKIYVLKNGEIVESGSQAELLSNNNHYRELWDTQQSLES